MPKSRKRTKVERSRAREAQSDQLRAQKKRLTPRQYMRRRLAGWSLAGLAVIIAITHWLAHVGLLYDDRGIWDLTIGFPAAALLAMVAAIVLSAT